MTSFRPRGGVGFAVTGLIALVGAGACDQPPAPSSSTVQVGDTVFVHTEEAMRGSASLTEILRIGVVEGPPEYMFARITMFAVGPDGHIFVAQNDRDLREYDAQGVFVQNVARPGQGPGEVQYVTGMDVAPDGRLALMDFANQRVSIYDSDGTFVRQIRRPAGRPAYGRDAIRWDANGGLWVGINPVRSGPDTLTSGPRPIYARLVGDGEVVDTVFLPERFWEDCERRRPGFAGGFFEDNRLPYAPFAHWNRSESGDLAAGCSASYSIDVIGGDRIRRISRGWEPALMSDEEREYYELGQRVQTGLPRARFSIPSERPAFLRMWLGDGGRLWAWRGASGESREATPEMRAALDARLPGESAPPRFWTYWSPTDGLDVFDPDGSWLGHVETPASWDGDPFPGLSDPYFRGDTIWAVTKDELEVRYISKFVLEWSEAG